MIIKLNKKLQLSLLSLNDINPKIFAIFYNHTEHCFYTFVLVLENVQLLVK